MKETWKLFSYRFLWPGLQSSIYYVNGQVFENEFEY